MTIRRDARVRWDGGPAWRIEPVPAARGRRRAAATDDPLVQQLTTSGAMEIVEAAVATPMGRRAATAAQGIAVDIPRAIGPAVIAVRLPSGAVRFQFARPSARSRRVAVNAAAVGIAPPGDGRRGVVGSAIKLFIFKVLGRMAARQLPALGRRWERARWSSSHRHLGLVRITREGLSAGALEPVTAATRPASRARNLLLLHGTFSCAEEAFKDFATVVASGGSSAFDVATDVYGPHIYAFNHFTVSESPDENARALLDALPDAECEFDVITHSRGGLILRTLVERQDTLGERSSHFRLGRALLAACPNHGTPLATADKWEDTFGILHSVLEMCDDIPWVFAADFLVEGLTWLAAGATGTLPGLAAMATDSEAIRELTGPPEPLHHAYSALVANYTGDRSWLRRVADLGVQGFFGGANDLVVPSEGGWAIGQDPKSEIAGDRVGCFGPGGNIPSVSGGRVHHLNLLRQPEAATYLERWIRGEPTGLATLDLAARLPLSLTRDATPVSTVEASVVSAEVTADKSGIHIQAVAAQVQSTVSDVFQLVLLDPERYAFTKLHAAQGERCALLVATYRNATVAVSVGTKGGGAGRRWRDLLRVEQQIKAYIDGNPDIPALPTDSQLQGYGRLMFDVLFPGEIRRLYDTARTNQGFDRLDVIFTSEIPWIAGVAWEFAYDSARGAYLATEEVNFVRNVFCGVPMDRIPLHAPPLRILVVIAQPLSLARLSADEEIALVQREFAPLTRSGDVALEVLRAATPIMLQRYLEIAGLQQRRYDVVHFIGHGGFDEEAHKGFLVFEDGQGGMARADARTLREIMCHREVSMLFLNACETGRGDKVDFTRGVAPELVAGGVPAVVANQFKVLDASAMTFAQHFYWGLAHGQCLADAAREARVSVNSAIAGEAIDWAVPVVYARHPDMRLCHSRLETLGPTFITDAVGPVADMRATRGRRGVDTRVRVQLWDVNHSVPGLPDLVARFNMAQDHYAFTAADLGAPLDTWRIVRSPDDHSRSHSNHRPRPDGQLWGEQVAQRLEPTVAARHIDLLFCITTFHIGDEGYGDQYLWENSEGTIALFTIIDLIEDQHLVGRSYELAVQRAVVNNLAFVLSGLGSHEGGTKACLAYYNAERDPRYIAGNLGFCAQCRRQLERKRPALVSIIDRLLAVAPKSGL